MFRQLRPYWCGPAALVAVQLELPPGLEFSQAEWAELAGTTSQGTSPAGLKQCLQLLGRVEVVRRRRHPFALGIVFDFYRDHWITVRASQGCAVVLDPWDGSATAQPWAKFRRAFLSSARESYALILG